MSQLVALITGCSSGFGLESSLALAQNGFKVYATMRNLEKKAALETKVKQMQLDVHIRCLDVNDGHTIQALYEEISQNDGKLDLLFNNAGYVQLGFFEELTEDEIRQQIETNFFGVQRVTRSFLPLLKKAGQAKIINMSSNSGLNAYPGIGAYNVSKWALEAFSESLRFELLSQGISVHLIEPGAYPTPCLTENAKFSEQENSKKEYQAANQKIRLFADNLFKSSPNKVEEISNKVLEIATSSNAKFRNLMGKGVYIKYLARRFLPWRWYEKMLLGRFN